MTIGDIVLANIYKIMAGVIFVIAYILRIEAGMRRNAEKAQEQERKYEKLVENIEKLENKAERERENMRKDLVTFRAEMNTNFDYVNNTLKEVIFRLGEKSDK